MRLSNDQGRKEGAAAAIGTLILSLFFYCILSYVLRGSILYEDGSFLQQDIYLIVSLIIYLFSLYAAFMTVRFLFNMYLRMRAYRIRKGDEWQNWRSHAKETGDDA